MHRCEPQAAGQQTLSFPGERKCGALPHRGHAAQPSINRPLLWSSRAVLSLAKNEQVRSGAAQLLSSLLCSLLGLFIESFFHHVLALLPLDLQTLMLLVHEPQR